MKRKLNDVNNIAPNMANNAYAGNFLNSSIIARYGAMEGMRAFSLLTKMIISLRNIQYCIYYYVYSQD